MSWEEKAEVTTRVMSVEWVFVRFSLNAALFEHYKLSQMTILGEGEHREGEGCRGGLTDDTLFPAS